MCMVTRQNCLVSGAQRDLDVCPLGLHGISALARASVLCSAFLLGWPTNTKVNQVGCPITRALGCGIACKKL